jgi:hypothetical protein
VTKRRLTSRKVVLTTAFLALAAGGTAACDAAPSDGYDDEYDTTTYGGYDSGYSGSGSYAEESDDSGDSGDVDDSEESDEVFYCADEDGMIVDEQDCVDDTGTYFLWHSSTYSRGLPTGEYLDGGDYFSATDRKARTAFKLPSTGTVRNGTVKTNVVGTGSRTGSGSGSSGTSGG